MDTIFEVLFGLSFAANIGVPLLRRWQATRHHKVAELVKALCDSIKTDDTWEFRAINQPHPKGGVWAEGGHNAGLDLSFWLESEKIASLE